MASPASPHRLRLKRLGIDTYLEPVLYMRADSPACRAEGFESRSRVAVSLNGRQIVASLNVVTGSLLEPDQAALSESAWRALEASEGMHISVAHPDPASSESRLRAKVYGERLSDADFGAIVADMVAGRYSDLQLAAFVTASAGDRMNAVETLGLTRAMIDTGERIRWDYPVVGDKHSIGGLPGNRTTPIVVAIVAACGLPIPKTSSRAITSPAGTADVMETLAPVALDMAAMRRVVEREGGCVAWGGAMRLAPADDILIRVERPLDFDSDGQAVASILSKKAAAGATHVVIDMPVGPTAKVRTEATMRSLSDTLHSVAAALGLHLRVIPTDGSQPVGRGIGPALEARDVLAVLRNAPEAPQDLRRRALMLAAELLEFGGRFPPGAAAGAALAALEDGRAWRKFQAICEAQGGMRTPPASAHRREIAAESSGVVAGFDNRRLGRIAKLAGAPRSPAAGLELHVRIGDRVAAGQPLFTVHAEAAGELEYGLNYLASQRDIVTLRDA
jgi:thymidine phosphorylase